MGKDFQEFYNLIVENNQAVFLPFSFGEPAYRQTGI
jgi:hypothetical protein